MKKIRVLVWILAIAFAFAFVHAPPMQANTNELNDETMIVPTTTVAPQIAAQRVPQPADSPPTYVFALAKTNPNRSNPYHRTVWADMPPPTPTTYWQRIARLPNSRARPLVTAPVKPRNHFVLMV